MGADCAAEVGEVVEEYAEEPQEGVETLQLRLGEELEV